MHSFETHVCNTHFRSIIRILACGEELRRCLPSSTTVSSEKNGSLAFSYFFQQILRVISPTIYHINRMNQAKDMVLFILSLDKYSLF